MSEEKLYVISLIKENDKLKEEIKKLKSDAEKKDNLIATYKIWNGDKEEKIKTALERIYFSTYAEVNSDEKWLNYLKELAKILKGEE